MLKRATDRIGVGNHRSFDCMRDGTTSSSALVFELCFVYEMTENVRQTRSETQKSTISCGVNRTGHELL